MWLSPLSTLTACLAGALGFVTMVTVPAVVFIALPLELVFVTPDLGIIRATTWYTVLTGGAATLIALVVLRLTPARLRLARLYKGYRVRQLEPHIWVVEVDAVQGYAMPSPTGGVIVVTRGAMQLPDDELAWLIAHEKAHLERGDAAANLWWSAQLVVLNLALGLASIIYGLTSRIPLLRIIPRAYYRIAMLGIRLAITLFVMFDKHLGRLMEYRADSDAAKTTTAEAGIRLLTRIPGALEPSWGGLFASHPPTVKRIKRLEALRQP